MCRVEVGSIEELVNDLATCLILFKIVVGFVSLFESELCIHEINEKETRLTNWLEWFLTIYCFL